MSQNLSSAAVVIGALRVKRLLIPVIFYLPCDFNQTCIKCWSDKKLKVQLKFREKRTCKLGMFGTCVCNRSEAAYKASYLGGGLSRLFVCPFV